jgi:hypothetical protein
MTGLDCTLEGSSFAEVSSFEHNGKFPVELVEISPFPLALSLDAVLLQASQMSFT